MTPGLVVLLVLAIVVLIVIAKTAVVVPQQNAYVVERLGRYSGTLGAGFHVLLPFVDVIRYRHSLKEGATTSPRRCASRATTCRWASTACCISRCSTPSAPYRHLRLSLAITQLAQTTLKRDRKDRSGQDVRRANEHQPVSRHRAR